MTGRWLARGALQLAMPLGLVTIWWLTSRDSGEMFYPPLSRIGASADQARDTVIARLREDWLFNQVGSDLLPSLGRFTGGYLLAAALGISVGTLIGLAPRLRRSAQPVTEFVRSIPPPLLLPFVLVTMGADNNARVALIALGSVWPVLLNTVDGVRGVAPETLDMARSFGLTRSMQISRVMLPAASPKIVVGLRTALSVALILMIISEMSYGGSNGLGFQVVDAQRRFDSASTYAGVIVIGVVGLTLNLAFLAVERWIMRWHRGARGLLEI